jgi:Cu/Ag efflux pump CusA
MDGKKSAGHRRSSNLSTGFQLTGNPKNQNIRASSMFGMSFVYIILKNVDPYWARTRVLERLNYAQRLLPASVVPTLGPDGTGVTYFGTIWKPMEWI